MDADIVAIADLSPAQRDAWREFQHVNPALASPYFTLDFALAVARSRADTAALVISRNGTPEGFLPLHLSRTGFMRPLAGPMGDHQALIAAENDLDPRPALDAVRINVFAFGGALACQTGFAAMADRRQTSFFVNLEAGADAYLTGRRAEQSKVMRNIRARQRKLDALGDACVFRLDDRRPEAFAAAMAMKRQQYRRTRAMDVFWSGWANRLAEALFETRADTLSGQLSTLEIEGEIAAAHFGMRSPSVLHYWFPVYAQKHARYGPGLALFMALVEHLPTIGVTQIHLGGGDYDFKRRLANDSFEIVGGEWCRPSWTANALGLARGVDQIAQSLPLGPVSAWPGKALRRIGKLSAVHGI